MDLATTISALVVASVSVACLITLIALWERPHPMVVPVIALTMGAAVWALPYGILVHVGAPDIHLWLTRIRYVGTAIVPLAFFVTAVRYSENDWVLDRVRVAAIAIIPAITTVLVWTSGWHDLMWAHIEPTVVRGVWTTTFQYGPWFGVHLAWVYALMIVSLGLLAHEGLWGHHHQRKTVAVVGIGGAMPFMLNIVHFGGIGIAGQLDPTPIAVGLGGSIVGIGVLLLDVVELRPIARDRLIENLQDGFIVVDTQNRIREANPIGRDILDSLGAYSEGTIEDLLEQSEVVMDVDGEERRFHLESQIVEDSRGLRAGRIIHLTDVTEIARREQRISVLHRVLRHNIRNEMTVLLGHLDYVHQEVTGQAKEDLQAVERSADRIMGFAENARLIELTLKSDSDTTSVDLRLAVEDAIDYVANTDVEIQLTVDDTTDRTMVSSVNKELLVRAVGELVENAVIHGRGPVEVYVDTHGTHAKIDVHDRGPGIPEGEIKALTSSVETTLEHGSGLGLWVAHWTAELAGGDLQFDTHDDGNIVRLRLPVASSE